MPARSAFQDGGNSRVFDWSEAKTRLGYLPDHNFDANNGEFYVDGAAGHFFAEGAAYNDTVTMYFRVNRSTLVDKQGDAVLLVGAYVREPISDKYAPAKLQGQIVEVVVTAEQDILPLCIAAGGQDPFSRLAEFALFLDVRRAAGSIDRLWMKNGNDNFLPSDIEQFEVYSEGGRYQLSDASPLFNLKKAHQG